jgi:benzoyl-CoA-dihydrodiol lyase
MVSYNFATSPDQYRHWRLQIDGDQAQLAMDVQDGQGLGDYVLKLNSYDLGVDIELADAIQRIRFEHPNVKSVTVTGLKDRVFCSGANIMMLGASSHPFKVNFCKFTNETRLSIEDASLHSGIRFLCALNGTASGGGYELALACDEILLIDDASSAVSLPEVPLLGVLPGTGGLTRVTDKRKVRRDLADAFCTIAEGVKGKRAVQWNLVDAIAPKSKFAQATKERAAALAKSSPRSAEGEGVQLEALNPVSDGPHLTYEYVSLQVNESARTATITLSGPEQTQPSQPDKMREKGSDLWSLKAYRELDDALLQLRLNHLEVGVVTLRTKGDPQLILDAERHLLAAVDAGDWFAHEVLHLVKRVLKRLDYTSRTFLALVEPESCFAGSFAELLWAADRSYMLEDLDADVQAQLWLNPMSAGRLPMGNGLSRLQTRFYGDSDALKAAVALTKEETAIGPEEADKYQLITFLRDDIDYPDEVRLFMEERSAMSPDALTGMEANLRWPGPETMETRIFGRLSAWQNWIFIRENATGDKGALTVYGSPNRAEFDQRRC